MKRTKRLLSTLLALCMVLAMLPATAMAAPGVGETPENPITDRYTVLVLDCSGSMWGTPMTALKQSAKSFCEMVTADANNTTVKNHLGIVAFATNTPEVIWEFEDGNNLDGLKAAIDNLSAYGGTYIENAITKASDMLDAVKASNSNVTTNIILLTDGLPEHGLKSYNNIPYTSNDSRCYQVANQVYARATWIWNKGHNLYTLGFFHDLGGKNGAFGRIFLRDISNAGYWEVTNPELLRFEFEKIATGLVTPETPPTGFTPGQSGNQYPYVQVVIRCPVNVEVTYRNQTILNSADPTKLTSSYGTIELSENGETKTVNLLYDAENLRNYNLNLTATGDGLVKVSATYFSADGTTSKVLIPAENPQSFTVKLNDTYRASIYNADDVKEAADYNLDLFSNNTDISVDDNNNQIETGVDNTNYIYNPAVTGGTIVLSRYNAEPGDWVNVYVTPDEGYELESITATDVRGWPVTLREMGENAFSFTMPSARVNINPVFVKVAEPESPYKYPVNVPEINNSSAPGYGAMVVNPAAMNYPDVNAGDWFYNYVRFCHERYLMNNTGEAEGKFEPNTPATRATIWTSLSRLAGRNTLTQGDKWYDRAQIWAKDKGVSDGTDPMGTVTREQLVTMLWRYDGNKYINTNNLGQFADSASVSWWATEAVKWAVANGLLEGTNGNLNPQGTATRAEFAAMLQRYVQNVH